MVSYEELLQPTIAVSSSGLTKPMSHREPSSFSWAVLLSLLFLAVIASSQSVAPKSGARFTDVTKADGITFVHFKGNQGTAINLEEFGPGVCVADFDGDGWPDIYFVNGRDRYNRGISVQNALYRNNQDGRFTDVTDKASVPGTGYGLGCVWGDYDNDGNPDLFVTQYGRNVLYHNNGNGTFTDVTDKAGVAGLESGKFHSAATFFDYDRDGYLDLYVGSYVQLEPNGPLYCTVGTVKSSCPPQSYQGSPNVLYHNNGDGTFTDVTEKAGILKPGPRYSITAVSYDFDNDGWPDIYIAVDSEPSMLLQNNHDGTFTDVAVMAGCAYNADGHEQAGMGIGVADYDCDGWLDILKTNFADDTSDLYHNNGDGTFNELSFSAGIGINSNYVAWGCGFIDYDNDGWKDIVQVNGHVYPEVDKYNFGETFKNPRLVYRNLGNGRFADVSAQMGPGITERFSSRGAAFGDFDNDGGMDILILNMNDLPSLLHNVGKRENWITLKLIGTKCNRTAIGARARVAIGKHVQMDEVHGGTSVMSQSDLRLHFGVGKAETVDWIEVKWPTTQKVERFTNVQVNRFLTIREGAGIVATWIPPAK